MNVTTRDNAAIGRMARGFMAVAAAASASTAHAQATNIASSPSAMASLPSVTIEAHYDNSVGSSDAASEGQINRALLKSRPAQRPAEILEFVPGVIVTQHSGDGKANQYFLRGFNLDHGTDFAVSLDGVPLNMPTQGHGQGYTDLNPLIPEIVDRIDYRKGPYFARDGDFALAGSASIVYRRDIEQPLAQFTVGAHGFRRMVGAASLPMGDDKKLLGAVEVMRNDGPWKSPERMRKVSSLLKYSGGTLASGWSANLGGYQARWNASDQVPLRAIESGAVDRFGTIDATDGGDTSRFSLSAEAHERTEAGAWNVSGWLFRSTLNIWGNLTYALDRPEFGDQGQQSDRRTTAGFRASREWPHQLFGREARTEAGFQLRHDSIHVGLDDTVARGAIGSVRQDKVEQTGTAVYATNAIQWTDWFRTVAGLRADRIAFDVASSHAENSGRADARQLSPKFTAVFGPWAKTEFFVNAGRGFHSNDARGATLRVDPRTGHAADPVPGLVSGSGSEVGMRTEWVPGLQSSLAIWRLQNRSELLYVGDTGTTEADRPGRRRGVEWNNRWSAAGWLLVDADFAWTRARFSDARADGNRIPGAVESTASLAATLRNVGPWSASIQLRYLGPRPLAEDNSVRAQTTLLTNLRVSRKLTPDVDLSVDVFNLLNRKADDIRYFYVSRLPGEAAPVADVHLHPAEPRTVRVTMQVRF